jgi:hypothetical protein
MYILSVIKFGILDGTASEIRLTRTVCMRLTGCDGDDGGMKESSKRNLLLLALGFFVASRLIIIFRYGVYISDLDLFKLIADYGTKSGYVAYRDFWFPYPPLALPLIYIPSYFSSDFQTFRRIFQAEMFLFDATTLTYMVFFLKDRMSVGVGKIACAVFLYSFLGLLVGHLIYDRFDLTISATFMISAYYFTGRSYQKTVSYFVSFLGAIIKLVPLFWFPVFLLFEIVEKGRLNIRKALKPVMIILISFIIFMVSYDARVNGGLFKLMGELGLRGIQIESVWASPLMFYYSLKGTPSSSKLNSEYAAQHINDSALPKFYLLASKYAGFFLLGLFFLVLGYLMWSGTRNDLRKNHNVLLIMLFVLTFLISTQRVLSPQYMIWLMPGLAAAIFMGKTDVPLLVHAFFIFLLTYIGFDLGYWKYVSLDLKMVIVVNLRNLLLLSLSMLIIFRIFSLKREVDSDSNVKE